MPASRGPLSNRRSDRDRTDLMPETTVGEPGPLQGVKVLELGSFISGPFAGQLLADLGADVIKLESPGEGDPMRRWGKMLDGRSIWWSALARGKRLIAIDLRRPEGRDLVRRLAASCDVVLENFAPGRLEAWGLGFDDLRGANRRLVMTRVSGFGQTGPRSGERGFGAVAEAMGGLRELTGSPQGPPTRAAVSLGDHVASLFAVLGTLAALRQAERDGEGQIVDVSLFEAVFALTESLVADYELTGFIRTRSGGGLPGVAPSNAYPTGDGHMMVIAGNADPIWKRLALAMGRPDLGEDPRFATHTERGRRIDEVDSIVTAWTSAHPFRELDDKLAEAEVPHGLIYRAPDILEDEHYQARGSVEWVFDPALERQVPMPAVTPRLARTPGRIRWPGGPVGTHTRQVLTELGINSPQLDDLVAQGVIAESELLAGPDGRSSSG
jgi:crotonobetainyl-CoA:carnitine CoA-transferase CaiB-like acyl-CoA transferase